MSNVFISDQNQESLRFAIIEDDGLSCWLYLTNPNESKPIADCWLYNRIEAPEDDEIKRYKKDGPPPASKGFVTSESTIDNPCKESFELIWSIDGNSIAALYKQIPFGYIKSGVQYGFSRNLAKSGPWGHVFIEEEFNSIFAQ
jgi:hypothetical protein